MWREQDVDAVLVYGSPGGARIRTFFIVETVIGIPFSRWGAQPFVAHPFSYPVSRVNDLKVTLAPTEVSPTPVQHPIRLALEWRQMLAADPNLNMARIAETRGFSRARVTQIMNLLRLPEQARETLLALSDPKQIRSLTEHRLRPIVACRDTESQNRQVQELVATLGQ